MWPCRFPVRLCFSPSCDISPSCAAPFVGCFEPWSNPQLRATLAAHISDNSRNPSQQMHQRDHSTQQKPTETLIPRSDMAGQGFPFTKSSLPASLPSFKTAASYNCPTPNSATPASRSRASSSIDDWQYETSQVIRALETSDDARSLRLTHHDCLLEPVSKKAGKMKQQITRLTSLDQGRSSQIVALENKINEQSCAGSTAEVVDDAQRARIDEIQLKVDMTTQVTVDAAVLLKQNNKDIEQFESKHSLHELLIAKLEEARAEHLIIINDLGTKYNDLNDAVHLLEQRSHTISEASQDHDVVKSHITRLKQAHGDILAAHSIMLQNHVMLNDRLMSVEQRDNALAAQLYDAAAMESRMSDIELSGSDALAAAEVLQNDHLDLRSRIVRLEERDHEQLNGQLEAIKKDSYRQLSRINTVQESTASVTESIKALEEQYSAQARHIELLTKKAKKSSDWVKYLTEVTNTQKDLIDSLQLKLEQQKVSGTQFKLDIESRIEQLMSGNQKREDAMIERIKALENKTSLRLASPYAQPKSAGLNARSEGVGTSSTRKKPRKF
ncbi:unnamed protein product [Diplocarpon coronariae]